MAQRPTPAPLAPDSPELFMAFFQFHDDFNQWADQRKAASALATQTLDGNIAKHFKVDVADLPKMRGVTTSVMANFRNIDKSIADHLNARAKFEQLGDPVVLQLFLKQRQQAALDGQTQLQRVLSSASWAGLHDYINNTMRLRYKPVLGQRH
jgi:hypothetical protein